MRRWWIAGAMMVFGVAGCDSPDTESLDDSPPPQETRENPIEPGLSVPQPPSTQQVTSPTTTPPKRAQPNVLVTPPKPASTTTQTTPPPVATSKPVNTPKKDPDPCTGTRPVPPFSEARRDQHMKHMEAARAKSKGGDHAGAVQEYAKAVVCKSDKLTRAEYAAALEKNGDMCGALKQHQLVLIKTGGTARFPIEKKVRTLLEACPP